MVVVFRLVYLCAALLASAAGVLVVASFFIPDRAPRSTEFLGIHLAVGAVFLGVGVLLFGIRRHVAGIAVLRVDTLASERRTWQPTSTGFWPTSSWEAPCSARCSA